jgi:radical SAM protein with 4Fe4S-binding SPASM domain
MAGMNRYEHGESAGLNLQRSQAIAHMEKIIAKRPLGLNLETVTRCNSRCVFCAYSKVKREKTVMEMGVFEKICREYSEMGGGLLGFAPLMSDPLLDHLLPDRIHLLNEKYPAIRMHMFTNGIGFSRLSEDELLFLVDSLQHLNISMGGVCREDYLVMFGVDRFDAVWETLNLLARLRPGLVSQGRIGLHLRTHRKEATLTHDNYKKLVDMGFNCSDIQDSFCDWGGLIRQEDLPEGATVARLERQGPIATCLITVAEGTVLPDGDVVACGCMDGQRSHVVGNVTQNCLGEIWAGKKYRAFRELFPQGRLPALCRGCSIYMPYDYFLSAPGLIDYNPQKDSFWEYIL